ncbi:MAG: hypothetical protein QM762_17990 [Chryseolinea sp.]
MKMIKVFAIVFLCVVVGYMVYLAVGMSSTYPALKEYSFGVSKEEFEEKLLNKVNSLEPWSFKRKGNRKDSEEDCYWSTLFYKANGQDVVYQIKYCFSHDVPNEGSCLKLELVRAFDYNRKTEKATDEEVERLVRMLDDVILKNLAPSCSK